LSSTCRWRRVRVCTAARAARCVSRPNARNKQPTRLAGPEDQIPNLYRVSPASMALTDARYRPITPTARWYPLTWCVRACVRACGVRACVSCVRACKRARTCVRTCADGVKCACHHRPIRRPGPTCADASITDLCAEVWRVVCVCAWFVRVTRCPRHR
jgi:hypothetical protein